MRKHRFESLSLISLLSFLFYVLVNTSTQSVEQKIKFVEEKRLVIFFHEFEKMCNNKLFFTNILNHHTYPSFGKINEWKYICSKTKDVENNKNSIANFIEKYFKVKLFDKNYGILTGYYEPSIKVSFEKDSIYKVPVLKQNKNFVYKSRKFIEKNFKNDDILLWTDNKIDFFFLQIQGSGIGIFPNGKKIRLSFNGSNELEYSSIGKHLKRNGALEKKISMFTIKDWLKANPEMINDTLNVNKRYIFFSLKSFDNQFTTGALKIPLKPYTSIAVDRNKYPLGIPLILNEIKDKKIYPVIAHDTGAAIVGYNRADVFTGSSIQSEQIAGNLKKEMYLFALIPYIENND